MGGRESKVGRQGWCITRARARGIERRQNRAEREITLKREGANFFSVPQSGMPEKRAERGDEDGRTATEGVALMGRERSPSRCRASCCNAKLKQNYLVPLSYGTRAWGPSLRRRGWLRRHSGAIVSCEGCILTRVKNGCLRPHPAPRRHRGSCAGKSARRCACDARMCRNARGKKRVFCLLDEGSRIY